nr:MAG TPA: Putative transferase, nesg, ydcK, Structural Genomics.38A [Caudoviricetes sp.]
MKTFVKSEKDTLKIKENLREAIYKSGLNITKVADKLGMTQGNLSQILSPNKNTTVSVYVALAICEITKTNVHSILPNRRNKPKKPKTPTKIKMSFDNDKFVMLSGDYKVINGQTVYRIKALQDFGIVKKGELGGYIAKESNLSFKEDSLAWVGKEAVVMEDVSLNGEIRVYGNATLSGDIEINEKADIGFDIEDKNDFTIYENPVHPGHVITASTKDDYMCVHNFDSGTRISGDGSYILEKIKQLYPVLESLDGKNSPLGIGTVVDVGDNRKYNYDMQTFYAKLINQHAVTSKIIRRKRAGV